MDEEALYSLDDIRRTYEPVDDHLKTRQLILRYSINRKDIRDAALDGLDLSETGSVLDLGCAYGFFTEKFAGRLKKGALITGLDVVDKTNSPLFLSAVRSAGYEGRFIAEKADYIKNMPSGFFDLIVASYSLYFFPHLIGYIARLLATGGMFLTITHTQSSLQEVIGLIPASLEAVGFEYPGDTAIGRLLRRFSMENGEGQLKPHFGRIEKIVFENDLSFPEEHIEDCIDYLSKKRNLLFKEILDADPEKMEEVLTGFYKNVRERAREGGKFSITKDDCIFRCYEPRA
ncbi:MAG: class I SAM-dependent methyltransferase [Syntrophales bacterium]|jgi:SAM-dependent methyltransferase|nr:class I SAM-dependent methyltransferase [Syntrophales bacterium]MDY0044791.1 class I SAM-dependent methyltransferase [Syntrophales bacterium]